MGFLSWHGPQVKSIIGWPFPQIQSHHCPSTFCRPDRPWVVSGPGEQGPTASPKEGLLGVYGVGRSNGWAWMESVLGPLQTCYGFLHCFLFFKWDSCYWLLRLLWDTFPPIELPHSALASGLLIASFYVQLILQGDLFLPQGKWRSRASGPLRDRDWDEWREGKQSLDAYYGRGINKKEKICTYFVMRNQGRDTQLGRANCTSINKVESK